MPRASLDIGSNSILLLVLDDQGRVLHDDARVVGLGKGLGDRGLLRADRVELALVVLREFVQRAEGLGVPPGEIQAVATSALRRALNGETFLVRLRELFGITAQVISGEQEAELTAAGAITGLRLPRGPVLVVDAGGGSTELIVVQPERRLAGQPDILFRHSFELGHVRLTERFFAEGPARPQDVARARSFIAESLRAHRPEPQSRTVVAVAGTPTAIATAELGLSALSRGDSGAVGSNGDGLGRQRPTQARFDGSRIHGQPLELFTLRQWIDRLLHASPEQRRALLPATPERADTMIAGVLILEQVLVLTQRTNLLVSSRGVRFALLQPAP